jgi:carbamoyltransferase
MTNARFAHLFGGPPRKPESPITQREMDLAASIQVVTEEIVLRSARYAKEVTGFQNLCLAGGVALNCVANGKIAKSALFKNIWVQPSSGDAGGALGAALFGWYQYSGNQRTAPRGQDHMAGSYLGPEFDDHSIEIALKEKSMISSRLSDDDLFERVAQHISEEKVVGWFQGRMEFGPRALGNRSILGDPRSENMQKKLNVKIKFRESFRPFAPSILAEHTSEYFDFQGNSPYMLMVAPVAAQRLKPTSGSASGFDKLYELRSELPAITHVDNSARIQTVHAETNERYHRLISKFHALTGVPVLINTSFNVLGEPIVCTPQDAIRCFMRTDMDVLVLGNYVMYKELQPTCEITDNWQAEFPLD